MYDVARLDGRVAIVTGANCGLGKEISSRLAGAGARVIMAVRSLERGRVARDAILRRHPDATLELRELDLSALDSVAAFVDGLTNIATIDLLANNAGVMAPGPRRESADGVELQWATNVLGPFALTARLLERLLAGGGRVATMSSTMAAYGSTSFSQFDHDGRAHGYRAYATSKLADLLFARRLAELALERRWDLRSVAAHPGYTRTNLEITGPRVARLRTRSRLFERLVALPAQSVEVGVEPMLYALTSPDALNGAYYGPVGGGGLGGSTGFARVARRARSVEAGRALFDVAEAATGVTFGGGA